MDYIFTQKELSYLDDIMPEVVKRSKEDNENEEAPQNFNKTKPIVDFEFYNINLKKN